MESCRRSLRRPPFRRPFPLASQVVSATFFGLWDDLVRRVAAPVGRKGLRRRSVTRAQDDARRQHPRRLDSPKVPWDLAVGLGRMAGARLPVQLFRQLAGTQLINDHVGGSTFRGQLVTGIFGFARPATSTRDSTEPDESRKQAFWPDRLICLHLKQARQQGAADVRHVLATASPPAEDFINPKDSSSGDKVRSCTGVAMLFPVSTVVWAYASTGPDSKLPTHPPTHWLCLPSRSLAHALAAHATVKITKIPLPHLGRPTPISFVMSAFSFICLLFQLSASFVCHFSFQLRLSATSAFSFVYL